MKKIIPVFLIVLILLLSACGTNSGNNSAVNAGNNVASDEPEAEPVNNEPAEEETQPQEPKYELSDYTVFTDSIFVKGYYWLTNTGDIPFEITDFSADIFDKDGVHINNAKNIRYQKAPVLPGKKAPIIFYAAEVKPSFDSDTLLAAAAEEIDKIVPEVHVKASDKLLSEVPFTVDHPGEYDNPKIIVENNTDEEISVVILVNKFNPEGTLIGISEDTKAIDPGYKEPVSPFVGWGGSAMGTHDSKYDVSVYRITENPDMTSYEY
ncbi:MAG: hypothetical protein J5562_04270 [Clostridia bacterium]|nr:hypothetical protein [Clostridia bacterium]